MPKVKPLAQLPSSTCSAQTTPALPARCCPHPANCKPLQLRPWSPRALLPSGWLYPAQCSAERMAQNSSADLRMKLSINCHRLPKSRRCRLCRSDLPWVTALFRISTRDTGAADPPPALPPPPCFAERRLLPKDAFPLFPASRRGWERAPLLSPPHWHLPLPSLVLAFLMTVGRAGGWGLAASGGATVTVSTAAAMAAAAAAAELPLKGLLALNSRHLAPSTVIILDMGILGFFLAIRGLRVGERENHRLAAAPHCVSAAAPHMMVLKP